MHTQCRSRRLAAVSAPSHDGLLDSPFGKDKPTSFSKDQPVNQPADWQAPRLDCQMSQADNRTGDFANPLTMLPGRLTKDLAMMADSTSQHTRRLSTVKEDQVTLGTSIASLPPALGLLLSLAV